MTARTSLPIRGLRGASALAATVTIALTALLVVGACDRGGQTPAGSGSGASDGPGGSSGSDDRSATTSPPAEPLAHALFGTIDAAAELRALAGTWSMAPHFGARDRETWVIDGDRVTISRGGGEGSGAAPVETTEGRLEYTAPGQLTVVVQEGGGTMRTHHSYARNDESLYVGLGTGGAIVDGRYIVRESGAGYLIGDGTSCRFHGELRGFETRWDEAGVEAPCALVEEDGRTWLTFTYPDPLRDGEPREDRVAVYGNALVGRQLERHLATPAE